MATRKLKFKPKPVVGGAVRRPREKEEILELTPKEQCRPADKESTHENIIQKVCTEESQHTIANTHEDKDESDSKRLKIDESGNELVPPLDSDGNHNLNNHSLPAQVVDMVSSDEITPNVSCIECNPPHAQSEQDNDLNTSGLVSLEPVISQNIEKSISLSVDSSSPQEFTDIEPSKETNPSQNSEISLQPVISQNIEKIISLSVDSSSPQEFTDIEPSKETNPSQNSEISLQPSNEGSSVIGSQLSKESNNLKSGLNTGKGLPRFGRSKFKPVLALNRKRSDMSDDLVSNKNEESPVTVMTRTESVIKHVKSEFQKSNLVSEIAESFSALESDESDMSKASLTATGEANESNREIYRFEYGNEDVTCITKKLSDEPATTTKSYLVNSNNLTQTTKTDSNVTQHSTISELGTSNLGSGEMTDKTHSNQLDQILDSNTQHSETINSSNIQTSGTSKVPVSPLKLTSKILVPKPCPNLLDTAVRRISFHGSDSEDESKRKNILKNYETEKKIKKEKNIKPNKRKVSQGSTYSKLGQEALEKFTRKFGKVEKLEPPDKAKLTMLDLIFYNPKSNPMSVSTYQQTGVRKKEEKLDVCGMVKEALAEESVDDPDEPAAPAVPVPQLKVGPDGQIILDPKSLIIETTEVIEKRAEMEKSEVIRDTGITRYNTYSKKKQSRNDWSAQETLQFYTALNTIGTDFSLMTTLFPKRSRHELKLKFKREERTNMKLVDKAMTAPAEFDFSSLQEELKHENEKIARKIEEKRLAAETAKKEKLIKKEEKEKNKGKNVYSRMRIKDSLKIFDESELSSIKNNKNRKVKAKKRVNKNKKQKKKQEVLPSSSTDTEDELIHIDLDSDEADREDDIDCKLLKLIKPKTVGGIRGKRKIKKTTKLEEYEEMNETLKRKMEIDSDSNDGYTPNGPTADMLFGSPVRDPFPEQEAEGSQWSMEVTSVPSTENTVLANDVENLSEPTYEQNYGALDLSLPLRATTQNDGVQEGLPAALNRHLISESIQIIDQLTSGEDCNAASENITPDIVNEEEDLSSSSNQDGLNENRIPLPSFESVSRSRLPVVYSVQEQFVDANTDENSSKIDGGINTPNAPAKPDHQDREKDSNKQGVVLSYYCNNYSEECILGD